MKRALCLLLTLCLVMGLTPALAEGKYTPGTYEASAAGFGGDIKIAVEVSEDAILGVSVLEHSETEGVGTNAIDQMPAAFVEANSADIDGVTGCTFSSNALKEAVAKALAEAAGEEAAPVSTEVAMNDGTYTATVVSFDEIVGVVTPGEMTMNVTIADNKITSIEIPEFTDSDIIGGMAFEKLTADVIEYQSMDVDTLTGATVSSNAFLSALAQCIEQAGGEPAALKAREIPKPEPQTVTYDTQIVVIGAGMAGLSAAVEAAKGGADVILVEKQQVYSSSTTRSLGFVMGANTPDQKAQGIEDTTDAFYDDIYSLYADEPTLDTDLLHKLTADSTALNAFLHDNGVTFDHVKNVSDRGARKTMRVHVTNGGGSGLVSTLAKVAEDAGAKVLMGTAVDKLIIDETGAVKGVHAVNVNGDDVTINAEATILCAGSYTDNPELLAELNPLVDNAEYLCGCGDGTSYLLGVQAGAEIVPVDYIQMMFYYYSPSWTDGFPEVMPGSPDMPARDVVLLNGAGERVINEEDFCFEFVKKNWGAGYHEGYCLLGAAHLDKYPETVRIGLNSTVKASGLPFAYQEDTIEAIAEDIGFDPEVLKATVEKYNAACASGNDEEFGKSAEFLTPIEAPYTILRLPMICTDGYTGVKINTKAEVISTDGNPIPGFYAAGSCACAQITSINYFGCGTSLLTCGVFGRQAAQSAIESMAK